jgi:hypothetical protein
MKWLAIGFVIFILAWYVVAALGAASLDDQGNRVAGWKRWLRFISTTPNPCSVAGRRRGRLK